RASPESFSSTRRNAGLPSTSLVLLGKAVALVFENVELVLLERLGDGLARVVDPLLVGKHVLAEEAPGEHPLHDPLAVLLRPRLNLRELREDLALRRQILFRDLAARGVERRREGDVHRHEPCDLGRSPRPHEDADLVRGRMDGRRDALVLALLLEPARPADDDVFADLADELDTLVFERFLRAWAVLLDGVEDLLRIGAELVVLGARLGLAADGHERSVTVGDAREDDALRRLPAGALARLRHAALTQELPGAPEIALRLLESALGVHHARAGLVAELLDQRRWNLSHRSSLPPSRSRSRALVRPAAPRPRPAAPRPAALPLPAPPPGVPA